MLRVRGKSGVIPFCGPEGADGGWFVGGWGGGVWGGGGGGGEEEGGEEGEEEAHLLSLSLFILLIDLRCIVFLLVLFWGNKVYKYSTSTINGFREIKL